MRAKQTATVDSGGPRPWWHKTALLFVLFCAAAPVAARALAGPPGALVHLRWQATIDAPTRERIESQYGLRDREPLDEHTWRYDLIDPRADTIRAIVNDVAVADTHDIDRARYLPDSAAVRTSRRQRFAGGDALVAAADALSAGLAALAALIIAVGIAGHGDTRQSAQGLARRGWNTCRQRAGVLVRWLCHGIPVIDARTAGVFRLVFGIAVVAYFHAYAIDTARLTPTFDELIAGPAERSVLLWLRAHPTAAEGLWAWLMITGAAFTVGILTRWTYALFVAGALVWAFGVVPVDSTHPHSTLILTLIALLPSRWGDALSVDAWLRARRKRLPPRVAGTQYGYTVWVPGLVLGVAFAAAAWAKLSRPPGWMTWIVNGSVKYHFITDSVHAPVDWGLQLAAHPTLAIVASFAAVAIEAIAVTAAFTRSERYRACVGIAALSLLAGFHLFMGVLWIGWWIPLLGFLPWKRLSERRRQNLFPAVGRSRGEPISFAQAATIVFLIGQQIVVSALSIERAPAFTSYPMYSYTYGSPAEFNARIPSLYRIILITREGRVELRCGANDDLIEKLDAALAGSAEAAATVWGGVRACSGEDVSGARAVLVEETRAVFDWNRLQFAVGPAAVVHGPLSADADDGALAGGSP